ncbi:MAG: ribulose-phosphate 3-epimerase [Gemmatimonadetes bacterium]|nr:ribulose-phosphate 3-epimerase [Gemmatimonadota bacterium]
MTVLISPSILSADFGRLAEQVSEAAEAGADWIHVDVMDGHFVPNITIGPAVTSAVRAASDLPVDVHLMIEEPDKYLSAFADAGADYITVHQEACPHLHRTIERMRELGVHPGVTLNPATSLDTLMEVIPEVDLALIMSVNPGFGGQSYIPASTEKIRRLRTMLDERGTNGAELEVDGGVNVETAGAVSRAGASVLVAGAAVFRHPGGIAEAIRLIRRAAEEVGADGAQ